MADEEKVAITKQGYTYHRPDCPMLKLHRGAAPPWHVTLMPLAEVPAGRIPCLTCNPPKRPEK
jgi:hypothetical protein